MQPSSGIRTWQWVVTVIVIIILIVIGIFVFGGKGAQAPSVTTENPSASANPSAVNRITMTDQYPGNIVYISSVQVGQPSWIVIQANNNGVPGKVIGTAHVDTGISPVKITLSQPTIDGGTYYAILYTDNGSSTFSSTADQPMKDANGNVIMHIFKASSSVGSSFKG